MSARSKVLLSVLGSLLALAMAALAGEAPGNRASILHQTSDGTQRVLQTGEVILTALPHVGDEILVRFKDGVSQGALASAHARLGAKLVKRYSVVRNLKRIKLPRGVSVEEAIESYLRDPNVLYAEPNYIVKLDATLNDPRFGELWGLHNIGQSSGTPDADIDAPEAWGNTTGSNNVVVAVIDTGVDYNHEDLSANMWSNTADCNNDGIDDDKNGYIDDCHGIDAVNNDSNPMDDHNHGTHVAGTIGAVGNNGIGVVGVNWNVSIMACKFLDASGSGTLSDAIECLDYVKLMKDRGVNVVATNNSWGGGLFSQALLDAIDAHRQRGILFIAAAGNSGADNDRILQYPASYYLPNIISVAASTRQDAFASFSNTGRHTVHLVAPGEDILSTVIGNSYAIASGTSMATPHVTGVAALLKAQNPGRDWRAIKNLILAGGDNLSLLAKTITQKRLLFKLHSQVPSLASGRGNQQRGHWDANRPINPSHQLCYPKRRGQRCGRPRGSSCDPSR
ncbi:MAG: S8 family serine peptidase [Deltaproteobacteria bacterium]|nr:S8 family serine peptidase [Deltaproteobacteria bacterium]